jgi:hypothetical protein
LEHHRYQDRVDHAIEQRHLEGSAMVQARAWNRRRLGEVEGRTLPTRSGIEAGDGKTARSRRVRERQEYDNGTVVLRATTQAQGDVGVRPRGVRRDPADIPGLGATALCSTNRVIGPGQTRDIFEEIYGDYELSSIDQRKHTTGREATVRIRVRRRERRAHRRRGADRRGRLACDLLGREPMEPIVVLKRWPALRLAALRPLVVALVAAGTSGCAQGTEPEAPAPLTYSLQSVDGGVLPHLLVQSGADRLTLRRGWIGLNPDGTADQTLT